MLAPRPAISPAFKKNTSLATPELSIPSDVARSGSEATEMCVDLKEGRWCNAVSAQTFRGRVLSPETRAAMKRWDDMEEDMFWAGWTQAVDEVQVDDVEDDVEVLNEQEQKNGEVCVDMDEEEHWLNEQLPAEQREAWLRVFKMFDDAWNEVEAEGAKVEVEVGAPKLEELPVFSQEQTYKLLAKTIEIEHQEPWLNKQLPVEQREAWSRVFDIFDDARRELEGEEGVNVRTMKTKYSQVRGFKAAKVDKATENKSAPHICASQLSWQGNIQGLGGVESLQRGRASKKSRLSKHDPVHNPICHLGNITNLDSAALPSNPHSIYQTCYDELIYPTHGMPYILGR